MFEQKSCFALQKKSVAMHPKGLNKSVVLTQNFEQKSCSGPKMVERKSCFAPKLIEEKSCFALQMFEQKSCFAPQMFEQKCRSWYQNLLKKSIASHPKCLNKNLLLFDSYFVLVLI